MFALLLLVFDGTAQPTPPGGGETPPPGTGEPAPISGIEILLGIGAAWGAIKAFGSRKKIKE